MFVLKGHEQGVVFMKKLKGRKISEGLRNIISKFDSNKINKPLPIPETFEYHHEIDDVHDIGNDNTLINEYDLNKYKNVVNDKLNEDKPTLFKNEPVINNASSTVNDKEMDKSSVSKKENKNRKQKKDKDKDTNADNSKSNADDKKESNPKSKSSLNKIDHEIINDSELIQKLEEQIQIKKRSRSRSRGDKTKQDTEININGNDIVNSNSNKTKKTKKISFEDLDLDFK